MKNNYLKYSKFTYILFFNLIFCFVFSQNEKQVAEIIKEYDMVKANQLLKQFQQKELKEKREVAEYAKKYNIPIFKENPDQSFDQLMRIDQSGIPIYYSIYNAEAAISTRVPFLRSGGGLGLNLTGTGMVPRMWDGGPIHAHNEYSGRINLVDNTVRNTNSFHAIHVMGTIMATGLSAAAKGMAPNATSRSFDWDNDESEAISEAMNGMLLSNHSYGVPVSSVSTTPWYIGAYSAEAYNWDVIAYTFPYYLPVMSAGNDGGTTNPSPTTAGYDKLNGNKNAKNIVTIANAQDATVDASGNITAGGAIHSSSSQGPSDDRRIKPDLTGDGAGTGAGIYSCGNGTGTGGTVTQYTTMLGTSMAAPNITGTLTLIQQHANNVNGKFLRAATLKGLVCHTATDRGNAGPDARYGWGYVDAKKSAETITNNGLTSWISEETLNQGQTFTMQVVATGGTTPLLGSICWTDVPSTSKINTGTLNESLPDLTNDLDIRITQGANTYYPWRLQSSATALALRDGDNIVDNVERINIDAPTAGTVYTITVTHKGTLADGPQKFALVVTGITSNFTFKTLADTKTICSNAGNAVYNFSMTKIGGANVTMSAANVPAGASLSFSQSTFSANGTFDVTISNLASVAAGTYTIDIIGNNGSETEIRKIYLTVYHPTFANPVLLTPANGATGITTSTNLTWQNDINVTSWDVEVSTSPTFASLAYSGNVTSPSFSLNSLASQTIYYWRVKPKNGCANGNFSAERSFQTAIIDCSPAVFNGTIVDGTLETTANGVGTATVNVTGGLTIGKITASVNITHTYVQDLTITLTGPAAIGSPVITLQEEACGGQPDINCTYDDNGVAPACSTTSPAISGTIKSFEALANLDGLAANGTWTLTVNDPYNGDGGTLNAFSLKICNKQAITPVPNLVTNTINVLTNSTIAISNTEMNATSTAQTDVQQTYTVLELPSIGTLKKSGVNLNVGTTFTQKDINDGIVTYTNSQPTPATTSFRVDVKNVNNGWVPSRSVNINIVSCGSTISSWNGTTWSNGVPSRTVAATFAGNYTSTGDLEACSITVNSGVNVTIGSGHTFVVGGSVTVNGTGTLTVNNNGALRQLDGAAVNTGNIVVKRDSAPMVRLDYTAWSSPVSGQQLQAFSPNTLPTRFYQYLYTGTTTPTAYQSVSPTTNFVVGKGYMIRAADNWPTTLTTFNGQFTGVPNNGNVSQPVGVGYNLLGNPYASPIDARAFLSANPSVGTLYFWTHTVAASGGVYPVNNYASYTTLGGTASAAGGAVPNGFIQTGQGFFVNATAAGNLNFTNTQRVNASSSTQFFRTSNAAVTQEVNNEVHRIWLNLNDVSNNYNQILVGYTNGATNGYDHSIDGEVLDKSTTMLYNVINDTEYVIQGKGLPFADTDEVALGLKATAAGTYTISLGNVDGLFASQDVFVKDNVTNIIHDIKQAPYVFTTEAGTFNTRFKLVYKNTVMSNEDFVPADHIVVFVQNDVVKVDSTQEIASVQVFDVLGRNIYTNDKVNEKTLSIASIANRNQALIVKVALTNGQTIDRKVIK
ncbi:Probable bifunctional protein: peptidase S8/S53 and putative adhesin [Flavobacterium indicum GPTSA100-9 = DSM 17447]|uniref:Probable bifunctional protein: peptidase S8/S53 and putative adhesin n=1 Tax=Flavobacterium indicum (strain DSM 17447 / CIP 109464 / GPTSA100-9) TaxID=1094466 RepID=H8XNS1_FLAIG|nr:S8 family serine peptidase [Flavobacterium indicum]CCG52188.1 Probable bifunctional protein: peptidase S8/S53 and putative adhesin [Flavobacterium indicum GPTSA100-9 = DSM 17447]